MTDPKAKTARPSGLTPMMEQFYQLKEQAGSAVLFFRMGDFYEIFGEDATTVAPLLDLVLTSREKGDQERIPFCGVPHHSARNYWLKLLGMGYKIAIADQTEDPATAKGLVRREIIRFVTPGCIDEIEGLEHDRPNYTMAVYEIPDSRKLWVAVADISTGELRCGTCENLRAVVKAARQFQPKEILVRSFFKAELQAALVGFTSENNCLFEPLPEAILRDSKEQMNLVSRVFAPNEIKTLKKEPGQIALVSALLNHFETLKVSLASFLTIKPLWSTDVMLIQDVAVRDLELFETVQRRSKKGSLYHEINRTLTPMGSRLLRHAMLNPMIDGESIRDRHRTIRMLLQLDGQALSRLREQLKGMPDLTRLAARIAAATATPRELALTKQALAGATRLLHQVDGVGKGIHKSKLLKQTFSQLELAEEPLTILEAALNDNPVALAAGGEGIFKAGFDKVLDEKIALSQTGKDKLSVYEDKLRKASGIQSLKVKSHKTFGLLIEVTKSNLNKVPEAFVRRQTMVNCERFVTDELRQLDDELSSAGQIASQLEADLFTKLVDQMAKLHRTLYQVASGIEFFDLMLSFAWLAREQDYCEPTLTEGGIRLEGSRHPVVESFVGRNHFVQNNLELGPTTKQMLITGPNMAGKSTIMRQTALIAILNQMGSYVPARKAELPLFDQIFTRVGAADDLSRGQSTFMVEMSEASEILRCATEKSLVILDEVGRGTSTQDGLAIAAAIMSEIVSRIQCCTLFATHFHELVDFVRDDPQVAVMQTEVLDYDGEIKFTHRLIPGASGNSFGIEVARLAGVPQNVIEKAKKFLSTEFAQEFKSNQNRDLPPFEALGLEPVGPSILNERYDKVLQSLNGIDVNRLTPLQALNLINKMKNDLGSFDQQQLFCEEPLQ